MDFHPAASVEIVEAADYYESEVTGPGHAFIREFQRITSLVAEQPQIGQRIHAELRSIVLGRFPYSIIYAVEPERIPVVAAAHQRRRPGYWRERIER